ncbi:MAG: PaaI-family thioesterase [Caulobacteraceae bacterium]|nr:PaaI-family thioesterase [Caulobacteraceae bacterium]
MSDPARLAQALARIPYAAFLGIEGRLVEDGLVAVLPFREMLIGNTRLPALHGGAQGAFLEIAALAALSLELAATARQPLTIGVTVEYLRPAGAKDTFARPSIKRLGRRIANVHVEAWQDDPASPVALLQGRFLVA